jgi:ribosomal protein S2/predicted RNA-binding protein with TRAM domain
MSLEEKKLPSLLNKPVRNLSSTPSESVKKKEESTNQGSDSNFVEKEFTSIKKNQRSASLKGNGPLGTKQNVTNSGEKKNDGVETKKVSSSYSKGPALGLKNSKTLAVKFVHKRRTNNLKIGDICFLKISAIGANGIGIDEYSYPFSIYIPNTNLNDVVKAKIVRLNIKGNKYGIAKVLKVKETSKINKINSLSPLEKLNLQPNQKLIVNLTKFKKDTGIVTLKYGYKLIIPFAMRAKVFKGMGEKIEIVLTRLKSNYGFAKIITNSKNDLLKEKVSSLISPSPKGTSLGTEELGLNSSKFKGLPLREKGKTVFSEGNKYTLTLPKTLKKIGNYFFLKLDGSVLFLKLALNAKLGDKVRIKITKLKQKFILAKIIQVNPNSSLQKRLIIRNSIQQMIKNRLHLGEKAVKCNARMKKYVWLKKQDGSALPKGTSRASSFPYGLRSLKGSGTNGKIPLIKKGNHIINLLKTRRCLNKALSQLTKYALKGRTFLFIGTKKAAAGLVERASLFSRNSFFVNTRWLGGLLTNWKTIRKSISKISPILQEKQKIIADILEKRKRIKVRLIRKGLFLKNKTQFILKKGRLLITKLKNPEYKKQILEKTQNLTLKQNELLESCQTLVLKHKLLEGKRRKLMYQNIVLKQHIANAIVERYNSLLQQFSSYTLKLRQLKAFLILSNEMKKIKNNTLALSPRGEERQALSNQTILKIGNKQIKSLIKNQTGLQIIPLPPKEILSFILKTVKANSKNFLGAFGSQKETDFLNIEAKTELKSSQKTLLISDFVSGLSDFVPELVNLIEFYEKNVEKIKISLQNYSTDLNKIKISLNQDMEFHQFLLKELVLIKQKLISQRNIIRIVKTKLKYFASQKSILKFLPRLKFFKISGFKKKILNIVQILMRKIVDPKLKYPIDQIYDQKLSHYSKKIASARKKKWQRFEKYFGGIAKMTEMNKSQISKNIAIIIGQNEEINAVNECKKLGIKVFNIVDTNCNPNLADHIVPANDDNRNSIKYVLTQFLTRIRLAQKLRTKIEKKQNQKTFNRLKTMANQIRQNFHLYKTKKKQSSPYPKG